MWSLAEEIITRAEAYEALVASLLLQARVVPASPPLLVVLSDSITDSLPFLSSTNDSLLLLLAPAHQLNIHHQSSPLLFLSATIALLLLVLHTLLGSRRSSMLRSTGPPALADLPFLFSRSATSRPRGRSGTTWH